MKPEDMTRLQLIAEVKRLQGALENIACLESSAVVIARAALAGTTKSVATGSSVVVPAAKPEEKPREFDPDRDAPRGPPITVKLGPVFRGCGACMSESGHDQDCPVIKPEEPEDCAFCNRPDVAGYHQSDCPMTEENP